MSFNVEVSIFRHWNITQIIDYIIQNDLTLEKFELKNDWITLQVSGKNYIDSGLFEEFISDVEYAFDVEQGVV